MLYQAMTSALVFVAASSIVACVQILNVDEYQREAPDRHRRRPDAGDMRDTGPDDASNPEAGSVPDAAAPSDAARRDDVSDGAKPTSPEASTNVAGDAGMDDAPREQEIPLAYAANVRVAIGGQDIPNARAVYVGTEQCDAEFKFSLSGYDPALSVPNLELWVAPGTNPVDCNLATNRSGASPSCWQVGSRDKVIGNVEIASNGRRLFNRDPNATTCPATWHTSYTVWFVPVAGLTQSSPTQPSAALDVQHLYARFSLSNLAEPEVATFFVDDSHERRSRVVRHSVKESVTSATPRVEHAEPAWTHVAELHNRSLFLYDSASGRARTARLRASGPYEASTERSVTPDLSPGWTHVVAVREDSLFFYNSTTLSGMTAKVDAAGNFTPGQALSDLKAWTHVVGTVSGAMFFYSKPDGTGAVGDVDATLRYAPVSTHGPLSKAWTHLTSVRSTVLFYDAKSGRGYAVDVLGSRYQKVGDVDGMAAGFERVVGTANGTLLLVDDQTNAGEISWLWFERAQDKSSGHVARVAYVADLTSTQAGAK